jgi:hypothetical protein
MLFMNFLLIFVNTQNQKKNAKFKARATAINDKKNVDLNHQNIRKSSSCENTKGLLNVQCNVENKTNNEEYSVEYENFKRKYPWQGLRIPANVDKSLERVRINIKSDSSNLILNV